MAIETTVIMPVRDGARHLAEAIESVLAQLGADDEVLVIDNLSQDDSKAVALRYAPRVTLLSCETPGVSATRNVGLRHARGRFIAFLDHDDIWPAGRHTALMQALLAHPEATHAAGRLRMRWDVEPDLRRFEKIDGVICPDASLMTCLFHRNIIDRAGLFDESMAFGEDTDFILRMREAGGHWVPADVDALYYRRHSGNTTIKASSTMEGAFAALHASLKRKRKAATKS